MALTGADFRVRESARQMLEHGRWSRGLLVDVGSTFTKVSVVEPSGHIIDQAHDRTTIDTDVVDGVTMAISRLRGAPKIFDWAMASSSAAGGLRMASVGLTSALSGRAGMLAALGAGAKVVISESGYLDQDALKRIVAARPHLLLLTGGIDHGNAEGLLHNAQMLAGLKEIPGIIIAGNYAVAERAAAIVRGRGNQDVRVVGNVFPVPGQVVVAPTREVVRDLFMEHITRAKGLTGLLGILRSDCEPTPLAVSRALWDLPGTCDAPVVLVDVGGATTDVHSIGGHQYRPRSVDLPYPDVMRTVEGDLGVRWGAPGVALAIGERIRTRLIGGSQIDLVAEAQHRHDNPGFIPVSQNDRLVDDALTQGAIALALERHAGRVVVRHNPWGDRHRVVGKDLRACRTLLATGGVFRHAADPGELVLGALGLVEDSFVPRTPRVIVDENYSIYAIGLVARHDRDLAQRMGNPILSQIE